MPSLKALPDAEERVSNAVFLTHGRAASRSGGVRQLALANRGLPRIPNLQPRVREGALDHRRFENCRPDLQLAASVRAPLEVDLELALEQPGPGETPHSRRSPAPACGRDAKLYSGHYEKFSVMKSSRAWDWAAPRQRDLECRTHFR